MSGSRRPFSRGPRYYKDYWDHEQPYSHSDGSSAGSPKDSASCVSPPAPLYHSPPFRSPPYSAPYRSPPYAAPYPPPYSAPYPPPPRKHEPTHPTHPAHPAHTQHTQHDWRRPGAGAAPGGSRRPDRRAPHDWRRHAHCSYTPVSELRVSPEHFHFRPDYDVRVPPGAADPADPPGGKRASHPPQRHHHHHHHRHYLPQQRASTSPGAGGRAGGRTVPDPLLSAPPLLLPARYVRRGVVARRWLVVPPYPVLVSWLLPLAPLPAPLPLAPAAEEPVSENYDALLALAARLQDDKPRGLAPGRIAALPAYRWRGSGSGAPGGAGGSGGAGSQSSCVVCLSEFSPRESVRVLPCAHEYHARCVDRWLRTNRSCPICRRECH